MELIPEWAPNIHPILVHFPIAIILLSVLMDLLNFFLPDKWWDDLKTTILYGIGAISAVAAYYTGTLAADSIFVPSGAQSVLNEHADWALWTVWFFGIYAVLRILLHWYQKIDQQAIRIGLFVFALPGIFFLYETGDHGAKMVFGYGAGTGQLVEQSGTISVSTDSLQLASTTFIVSENGNWSWEIGPNGVSTLLSRFRWLEGSASELQPTVVSNDNNHLLQITVDSTNNFFVGKNSFQNVQVDYYLDLSDFEGGISLVNHVQDAQNYDFVTLSSGGTISQGRVSEGNREVFAEESYSASGMLFIRTVVNGTHFRVYINKEMALHGHGDAPEAGSVGLRLDGTGTVLIDRMTLTQLNNH
ncbi:hypothetical protein NC796_04970 [Aliifodinibius sp. S!AR15-10]|uniref:DUF2231 domain-containing protein n=1 Tax=Aliifodinibius sp. S!AR15-10 TaxID=2950437 RepID=UPI00285A099D|nr:DUF2231 domain-containing protein [Aliifodinibius sp. S!AR15-10]MDR8390483.1 hypothetical protein [Aliifodinibius sp. S!AR15-10]